MSEIRGAVAGTHELVVVEGPGAASFLQGILSQEVAVLEADKARRSFLLGPQGKLRALLWVARDGDRFDIYSDAGFGGRVAADLAHYKIRVKADITQPMPAWQVIGGGEGVAAALASFARSLTNEEPSDLPLLASEQWQALRIEAGEPVMGVDVDEGTIPQETGLVDEAVSFTKGCYLGQELVARIDTRGRVNRHLRGLRLAEVVRAGSVITLGGDQVGTLTSVAWSDRLSAHIGLAIVKRTVEPGDTVDVGGTVAEVVELPF
ncbi:MAG: glycine cleavage T C-terminal barrel domain-containing protein [Acidimicrobiia bacterium]|nr:glycine cleavage T C-terminal barrel domain-containing protein [Acidimicrobiia bacterium]